MAKTSLLLFGSFCIAYNAANVLHELGHCIAVWLGGGSAFAISLNPFTWNFTYYSSNPNPVLSSWGGVLFGVILAVAISLIAIPFRTPRLAPLYLFAGCALAVNGVYFAVAAFANAGDAGDLLRLGVPRELLVALGLALLLGSCICIALAEPFLGLASSDGFLKRSLIFLVGIGPYMIAMAIYAVQFSGRDAALSLAFAGAGIVFSFVLSISGRLLRQIVPFLDSKPLKPSWATAVVVLFLGLSLVAAELIKAHSSSPLFIFSRHSFR